MKIQIKQTDFIDYIIYIIIVFYVFIAHWIWVGRGIQESILIILALYSVVINLRLFFKDSIRRLISCILFVILFITTTYITVKSDRINYFWQDIKPMGGSFLLCLYFSQLYSRKQSFVERLYIDVFLKWINAYMLINTFIIFIQCCIPNFMMINQYFSDLKNNAYYDQLCGFFGRNGTTRWNIISCAVILLNYNKCPKSKYNIFFIAMSVIVSLLNGSRSFFISLPLVLILYYFVIKKETSIQKIKYVFFVMVVIIGAVLIYHSNSNIKSLYDNGVGKVLEVYTFGDINKMIKYNDDRIVATSYAVIRGGFWGKGIGSAPMHVDEIGKGFVQYMGLNSASSYVYMIGIVGYFIYSLILARMVVSVIGVKKLKIIYDFIFLCFFLVMSYILPLYSSMAIIYGVFLIIYVFALEVKSKKDRGISL